MTVAEYIADKIFKAGIKYVFGIPGGPSIPYIEAFRRAGIDFILTSNEAAAGIMADVCARLTGIPGVCHATFGPGATNLLTGAGSAFLDRSPVIIMTSELGDDMIERTAQMNINHQKLFEPVTKASFRLTPDNTSKCISQALKLCMEEYPGPVHIGIPSDIACSEAASLSGPIRDEDSGIFTNDINSAVSMIEKSSSPLLAAGLTAARFSIGPGLLAFLENYKIPVVLTPMAKGLLNENHQCYAGVLFHALSDKLESIFENTDLVIGLGYDPVEYNYESWMPDVPLLHFNTKETDMPPLNNIVQYCGLPDEWFSILRRMNPASLKIDDRPLQQVRNYFDAIYKGIEGRFGPLAAFKILQEELPEDTFVTFDVGSHLHVAGQFWRTSGRQNMIMTNGWSGMGFGLPASLAVKLINPEKPVVCVTGDGGFLMMAGEILTARRYDLPVLIIVFSDGELNLIKLKQAWQKTETHGTSLYKGDLFDSEKFFGVEVLSADTGNNMRKAIRRALFLNKPVIINARIDPDDYKRLVVQR